MAGGSPTKEEHERRLSVVEQAIARYGWSVQVERNLARGLGVTQRSVRRLRAEVERLARSEIERDRRDVRASFLTRLHGHQQKALERERFGPLASMMGLEARMLGVLDPPPADQDPDELEATSKADLLRELAGELSLDDIAELARLKSRAVES